MVGDTCAEFEKSHSLSMPRCFSARNLENLCRNLDPEPVLKYCLVGGV